MSGANRTKPYPDAWREHVDAKGLRDRLQNHAFGLTEMTVTQIKAAEILLRKIIPDLKAIEHSGGVDIRTESDAEVLARIKTNAEKAGIPVGKISKP